MENQVVIVFLLAELDEVLAGFGGEVALKSNVEITVVGLDLKQPLLVVGLHLEVIKVPDLLLSEASEFVQIFGVNIGRCEGTGHVRGRKHLVLEVLAFEGFLHKVLSKLSSWLKF